MRSLHADRADIERDATILVKTFERPESLRWLLSSIRRFYSEIAIVVVDDSEQPLDPVPAEITRYLHVPFGSLGVSAGRNYGLRHVETPYVVVSDDDMVFERRTNLARMLTTLKTTRFGVVSCKVFDHDPWRSLALGFRRFEGSAEITDGNLVRHFGASSGTLDGLPVYDVVAQFFMARVETLGRDPWDASLKVAVEHVEFFLRLQEKGVLSTLLSDVVVQHHPKLPPRYYETRVTGREDSFRIWARQRGFDEKVFVGRSISRRDRLRYYAPSVVAYAARRGCTKTFAALHRLATAVLHSART
jgi:glycosyltransferase involved in cell wall biosynthesis